MYPSIILQLLSTLQQLRQHEGWSHPQLETYQAQALQVQRAFAYAHSPFYQKFHEGLFACPLNELPILTKALLMEHFDDLVTDRDIRLEEARSHLAAAEAGERYLGHYWVAATSGSSGQPGIFPFSESEWPIIMASFARGQEWSGAKLNLFRRRKMATVASTSAWHMSSQVSATARTPLTPSIRIAASDSLDSIVARLNHWQPDLLVTYASMARILAEEQLAGRLQIHPEKSFTSSEVLTGETRQRVKEAWGSEPFNQYGATETADIAAECSHSHRLHLFEDLVITEVVDEHYQPVPAGVYGAKVLVTTLFSRTLPLIRYEINDSLRLAGEPCPCGLPFTVVEGIQGRMEDTLYLPSRAGSRVAIQPLVFDRLMDLLPITGWQVVQEADDGLTILLSGVRDGLMDAKVSERVRDELAERGAVIPNIRVKRVAMIPKTAAGKAPLIRSLRAPSAPSAS